MKAALRRFYEKKYGHLYNKAKNLDHSVCVYCGDKRQVFDHVPPISKLEYIDVDKAQKNGMEFVLYPACNECNARLSSRMSIDLLDRMAYLAEVYLNKADKIERWTKSELNEMGPNLRSLILKDQNRLAEFSRKAEKILAKMDEIEGRTTND